MKASKLGSSLGIIIPKSISDKLNVSESEHIGIYEVKGEIMVGKI